MLCMSRNKVASSCCVLIIIRQKKSLEFLKIENSFQTHAAGFIRSPYLLEKDEKVS